MILNEWALSPIAIALWVGLLVVLRRRGRSIGFVLCVSAFYLYLLAVFYWTVLPIEVDSDFIAVMRANTSLVDGINIMPFIGMDPHSVQVYGNFLMGVPFGFGLPFVVGERRPHFHLLAAALFAVGIELVQLAMDLVYGFAYRKVDIDDVFLVWAGAVAGYAALRVLATAYCQVSGPARTGSGIWSDAETTLIRMRISLGSTLRPGD